MDTKAIADQVMQTVGEAPEKLQEIVADPKAAIESITGEVLDEGQVQEVLGHVKETVANAPELLKNIDLPELNLDELGAKVEDALENSPLAGVKDAIGGLFNKQ